MKTMKNLWLARYMERRRRAAFVARQRMKHPFFYRANWLAGKLVFDREFRALMRANYFYPS